MNSVCSDYQAASLLARKLVHLFQAKAPTTAKPIPSTTIKKLIHVSMLSVRDIARDRQLANAPTTAAFTAALSLVKKAVTAPPTIMVMA